jgi:hypothetical protein
MKDMSVVLAAVLGILAIGILVAIFGGWIVYLTWPIAIPAAFPGLVASGTLAASLTFWQSVCLAWLAGCLVKSSHTSTKASSSK